MEYIALVMDWNPFFNFNITTPEDGKNFIRKKIVDTVPQKIAGISYLDQVCREYITTVFIISNFLFSQLTYVTG